MEENPQVLAETFTESKGILATLNEILPLIINTK